MSDNDDHDVSVGASEIAPALGLSPYKTPFRWQQERLGAVDREPPTEATEMGKRLEPVVLRSFVEDYDVAVTAGDGLAKMFARTELRETGVSVLDPLVRWRRASPDAVIAPHQMSHAFIERFRIDAAGGEHVVLEAKSTGLANNLPMSVLRQKWGKPGTDAVPRDYLLQVHGQVAVVDNALQAQGVGYCKRGFLRVLGPGLPFADYEIVAVPAVLAFILDEMGVIVREALIERKPLPATTIDDYDLLADVIGKAAGAKKERRPATFDEDLVVAEWLAARDERDRWKLEAARLRAEIIGAIGDGWGLTTSSGPVTLSFPSTAPKATENNAAIVADLKLLIAQLSAPSATPIMLASAEALKAILKRNTHLKESAGRALTGPRKAKDT